VYNAAACDKATQPAEPAEAPPGEPWKNLGRTGTSGIFSKLLDPEFRHLVQHVVVHHRLLRGLVDTSKNLVLSIEQNFLICQGEPSGARLFTERRGKD
jgi:hypothetical protein